MSHNDMNRHAAEEVAPFEGVGVVPGNERTPSACHSTAPWEILGKSVRESILETAGGRASEGADDLDFRGVSSGELDRGHDEFRRSKGSADPVEPAAKSLFSLESARSGEPYGASRLQIIAFINRNAL
jgi:hypothetical protein